MVIFCHIHAYAHGRVLKINCANLTYAEAPLDRLAILHIANRDGAEKYLESICDIAPEKTIIMEVTPTLGTHIGPGSLGVVTLNQNWRQ